MLKRRNRRELLRAALPLALWGGTSLGVRVAAQPAGQPTIRLSTGVDSMPLSARDAQGRYVGMIISALDTLNAELGWRFDYADIPWKRTQSYVRQGMLDALCAEPTVERRTYVRFASDPLFTLDSRWAHFSPDNPKAEALRHIETLDQLKSFRIGLGRGDSWPNDLMTGPGWHTTEVESLDLLEGMARAGRIDLFFESPEVMLALTRKLDKPPLGNTHIELLPGGLIPYTFGLRKSFPGAEMLIGQFNGALTRAIADGRMEKALAPFRTQAG